MCFALCAWFPWSQPLAGMSKTATGKACNESKTLEDWDWTASKYLNMHLVFQANVFLIPVFINNKRSSGTAKPVTAFP